MERKTGLEPATSTWARWRSTIEPLPQFYGRGDRSRTCDLMVPNHARYHLRHTPKLVRVKRFELLAHALEGRCSIQLSYAPTFLKVERVKGIEPSQPAWKAGTLPLSYTRMWSGRRDSNPQLSPWQGDTLPLSHFRMLIFSYF